MIQLYVWPKYVCHPSVYVWLQCVCVGAIVFMHALPKCVYVLGPSVSRGSSVCVGQVYAWAKCV